MTLLLALALVTADDQAGTLKDLAKGYEANCRSLVRGKSTFVVVEGTADEPEAVRRGEIKNPVTSKCVYIFDGPHKRYEQVYADDDLIAHTRRIDVNRTSFDLFLPVRMLTNGQVCLIETAFADLNERKVRHQAQVRAHSDLFDSQVLFPLHIGFDPPSRSELPAVISRALEPGSAVKVAEVERDVAFEGRKVVRFRLEYEKGARTYWVDRERGCLPLQVTDRDKDGQITRQISYTMIQSAGAGAWFPRVELFFNRQTKRSWKLVVENLSTGKPDPAADFEVIFPEEISVIDTVRSLRHGARKSFSLADFDAPTGPDTRTIQILDGLPPKP